MTSCTVLRHRIETIETILHQPPDITPLSTRLARQLWRRPILANIAVNGINYAVMNGPTLSRPIR